MCLRHQCVAPDTTFRRTAEDRQATGVMVNEELRFQAINPALLLETKHQDLHNLLIKKYKRLASMNQRLVFRGVKLGKEDITALQVVRLILVSNAGLLNGFVQRFVVLAILLH